MNVEYIGKNFPALSLARAEFPIQTSMFLNVKITAQVRMRREKKTTTKKTTAAGKLRS